MQIQRIQSIWLILGLVTALCGLASPWWANANATFGVENSLFLLILGGLAVLLPLLALFMYRNLNRQITTCGLAALMALATVAYAVIAALCGSDALSIKPFPIVMLALSAIFDLLARRAVKADRELLRSADRIR